MSYKLVYTEEQIKKEIRNLSEYAEGLRKVPLSNKPLLQFEHVIYRLASFLEAYFPRIPPPIDFDPYGNYFTAPVELQELCNLFGISDSEDNLCTLVQAINYLNKIPVYGLIPEMTKECLTLPIAFPLLSENLQMYSEYLEGSFRLVKILSPSSDLEEEYEQAGFRTSVDMAGGIPTMTYVGRRENLERLLLKEGFKNIFKDVVNKLINRSIRWSERSELPSFKLAYDYNSLQGVWHETIEQHQVSHLSCLPGVFLRKKSLLNFVEDYRLPVSFEENIILPHFDDSGLPSLEKITGSETTQPAHLLQDILLTFYLYEVIHPMLKYYKEIRSLAHSYSYQLVPKIREKILSLPDKWEAIKDRELFMIVMTKTTSLLYDEVMSLARQFKGNPIPPSLFPFLETVKQVKGREKLLPLLWNTLAVYEGDHFQQEEILHTLTTGLNYREWYPLEEVLQLYHNPSNSVKVNERVRSCINLPSNLFKKTIGLLNAYKDNPINLNRVSFLLEKILHRMERTDIISITKSNYLVAEKILDVMREKAGESPEEQTRVFQELNNLAVEEYYLSIMLKKLEEIRKGPKKKKRGFFF
ncbi:hypothetical protein HZC32_01555 [Candidatus Woesearchaeota archaeon]|nr:hypothetical protein [Candidatus Woesearchaeota archaeon]